MRRIQEVRLYPSGNQHHLLDVWLMHCRWLWNRFLQHRIQTYKRRGKSISCYDSYKLLSRLRQRYPVIAYFPLLIQRDVLNRLDKAFKSFFKRLKNNDKPGFPRFKGRDYWRSILFLNEASYVQNNKIRVPKLGLISCRNLRPFVGKMKGLRIICRVGKWYAQLLIDIGTEPLAKVPIQTEVGIDVGLEYFATFSTGEHIENPRFLRKIESKIKRVQRICSRRKKRSNRRKRAKLRITQLHQKVVNSRRNFTHHVSKDIVKRFDLIGLEKLRIKNIVRNKLLSKSIFDAAWGELIWQISYKAEEAGKTVCQVDPCGTSQICAWCGKSCPKNLKDRWHTCSCGASCHRDQNSAQEILNRAQVLVRSVGPELTHGEPSMLGLDVGSTRYTSVES